MVSAAQGDKFSEKEKKEIITAFEISYGYPIRELAEQSDLIKSILQKCGIERDGD